jgi:hypothetical protein
MMEFKALTKDCLLLRDDLFELKTISKKDAPSAAGRIQREFDDFFRTKF